MKTSPEVDTSQDLSPPLPSRVSFYLSLSQKVQVLHQKERLHTKETEDFPPVK